MAPPGNGPVRGRSCLLVLSRCDLPGWPRYRKGAKRDERRWIESLTDRELARLAAELYAVEKAVRGFRKTHPKRKDAA
jgi:hypothetical protein